MDINHQDYLQKALFAEIIIPLALPKNYIWQIPPHLYDKAFEGCRAEVILGKQKKYAGIIKKLTKEKPAGFEPKFILNMLDTEPIVFPHQLLLWQWIAEYYMCSEGEVMAAALPSYFKLSSETVILKNEDYGDDFSFLDNDEYLVAEALSIKKELKLSEVQQLLDATHVYPVIKRLIEKRVCFVWEALKDIYAPKKDTYVLLNEVYNNEEALASLMNNWGRAPKQLDLLLSYLHLIKTEGEVKKTELLKKSGASDAILKGLVEKEVLRLEKRTVDRIAYLPRAVNIDFELSALQNEVLQQLNLLFLEKQVCLLHGVTASGKTLVYIRLIEACLKKGKQVLYLLPEITLTAQIIRRLQKHFGGYVGIYHSKFNQNERIEIWNKIKSGELKVLLGARSSLFLPFRDLGLIIVDEEHDASFKQQDPAPRYHARDCAIYYAGITGAKVLLGSATPSVETYYNARQGKYGFTSIAERYNFTKLPEIEIIDIKAVPAKDKQRVILTPRLKEAIQNSLDASRQVILFQNRRGYTPYQICEVCGWIPQCKHCDVSLTFHKLSNKLVCHYCGTTYPQVSTCMACGNHQFVNKNFGTEKIEELLDEEFPKAKIARMDIDAIRGKHAHENLIQLFEQKRIDILVGTQMVSKGLDFEQVNLVGILDADGILSFADFRVNERAFQLMEQVSGRAGRKGEEGRVLIQASNTQHPVFNFLLKHDYESFFKHEIASRETFSYPPFSRTVLLTFRHKSRDILKSGTTVFAEMLKSRFGDYLVGPAEPVVNRVRNQFLMELLIKLPKDGSFIRKAKKYILEQVAVFHQNQSFKNIVVSCDVDPV